MLEIHSLSKSFGPVMALSSIDLQVPAGQMVGIIGRSGAGKSTLLRLINRLADPSAGRIVWKGGNTTALSGRALLGWRARCAMIFQQFNLVPRLDVLTNVLLGRISYHRTLPSLFMRFSERERALAVLALERLDCTPLALQRAETLSGGQQQRVAIARALVNNPSILLADEPTGNLDTRTSIEVMGLFQRLNIERGITVVLITHEHDIAEYGTRIVSFRDGVVKTDRAVANRRTAAEELAQLPAVEEAV